MMENRLASQIFLFLLIAAFPCVIWAISALSSPKPTAMTGRATVTAHRTWLERGRKYHVCFKLSDGSMLELRTVRVDYETLLDGQSGQLTWENDLFLHFDPDLPERKETAI